MKKHPFLVLLAIYAALMLIFTFADLPVDLAVYNPNSSFGHLFDTIGVLSSNLLTAFCFAALWATRSKTVRWKNIIGFIVYGFFTLFNSAMILYVLENGFAWGLHIAIYAVLALALCAVCMLVCKRIAQKHSQQLRRAALIGIVLVYAQLIVIESLKIFWGRPRFWSMENPATGFVPWYLPQGLADGDNFKSFPSGHAGNAATAIWITLLPSFSDKLKGKAKLLGTIAILWMVLVMASRVILGAHFPTDVITGSFIALFAFVLAKQLIDKYYAKKAHRTLQA